MRTNLRIQRMRRLPLATVVVAGFLAASLPAPPARAQSVSSGTPPAQPAPAAATNAAATSVTAGFVVVDLTANPKDPDATQIVSFRARTASNGPAVVCATIPDPPDNGTTPYAINQLAHLVDCANKPETTIGRRAAAATHIKRVAGTFVKRGTPRLISDKGEVVTVIVIDQAQALFIEAAEPYLVRGRKPKLTFEEKARESQFQSDLKSLIQVVAGIVGLEAGDPAFKIADTKVKNVDWPYLFNQKLRLKRATVTVAAESGKSQSILQAPPKWTAEAAAQHVEEWDAVQVQKRQAQESKLECDNGVPKAPTKATQFSILVCRAQAEPVRAVPDVRIAAVDALGELGDARAAPVLTTVIASAMQANNERLAAASIAALAKLNAPAPAPAAPAAAADETVKPRAELLTGPVEHWFLSADVPLNSVEALTYDKDTNQVTLGDEPSTFYIGVNFLLGDVKETNRPFLGNLVIRGMVKASTHPLDSVGVGIGLRGQYFTKWGLNLDALTPFIAWTMTKEDAEVDGVVTKRVGHNSEFRFGVSLNLDQAIKWVGGK